MADGDILPVAASSASDTGRAGMKGDPFAALRQISRQPAVQRAMPALGLLGATALAALAYWGLQSPPQTPIFQGLADADKAAVTEALQGAGIAYEINTGTGTIDVPEDDVQRARIMLAAQGLPKAAPSGDALIAKLPMGSSRAVEDETLRGAREMDLARTIEGIEVVKTARIHLAVAEPSVFVRDQAQPAASVMLTLQPGRTLSAAQVRAIRHLVASSVPGLSAAQVSIIDQSGALLSQDDAAENPAFQLQMKMEERYRQALIALLSPILGADNFTTEVHADINLAESQSTRETYPKDDRALRREEGSSNASGQSPAGGIPGALANQPPPATNLANTPGGTAPANGATGEQQKAETYDRTFDVGREISVTHQPQGQLARLTVAVALRDPPGAKPRTPQEIAALDALVKGAVGFNAQRGDVVAINSRAFAMVEPDARNFWDAPWFMPLVRQAGAVLVALLLLFFVGRPMLKAMKARAAERREAAEIERNLLTATDGMLPSSSSAKQDVTIDMIAAAPGYEERAALVRSFVRQNPDRAALIVRQLMEGRKDG